MRDNGNRIKTGGVPQQDDNNIWVIGHLHTKQKVGNSYYPGTPYQLNFGENPTKGWALGKFKYNNKGKLLHKMHIVDNDSAFKLLNLIVESANDLKKIVDNPLYRYKLFVKEGVELPTNTNAKYPNIENTLGFKTNRELQLMGGAANDMAGQIPEFSLTTGLKDFLLTQLNATEKQANRALELIEQMGSLRI